MRYLDDRRAFGVVIGSVTLGVGDERTVYPGDHLPAGRRGWHAYASANTAVWRWTDGAGEQSFEPLPEAAIMEVWLSGSSAYILDEVTASLAA